VSTSRLSVVIALLTLISPQWRVAVADEACMVSPTQQQQVSGRFGKFREGGAANFGSGNSKPHMHDGLDFTTAGAAAPILATTDGTVIWARLRGTAGNTVMIQRDNGEIATYYHLSAISVKEGTKVIAGQQIGLSGNTGMAPDGAVHLHFIYGVPQVDNGRVEAFSAAAAKNPTFNPAQLPNAISKRDFGYATDPSPYFCATFPIQNDGLYSTLGTDTKSQYAKLFDATPPMGVAPSNQLDPGQIAAANGDALQAAAKGASGNIAMVLSDAEGYGALPSPPLGDYESLSASEMLATEAMRRFTDAEWNTNIVNVGTRALRVDYLRALGVAAYLDEAIRSKREHVEALLAVYAAQRVRSSRGPLVDAQQRAAREAATRAVR
jgi:murein DD-endopeptidase